MTRHIITLLICAAAALSASEAKEQPKKLGPVLGQKEVDAGHVLEARAVDGKPGLVVIRWGDLKNAIAPKSGKGSSFAWSGSASAPGISLVKELAFEDGSGAAAKPRESKARAKPLQPQDRLTNDNNPDTVTWDTKTSSAWDGVVIKAASGATLTITSGPATLSVTVP